MISRSIPTMGGTSRQISVSSQDEPDVIEPAQAEIFSSFFSNEPKANEPSPSRAKTEPGSVPSLPYNWLPKLLIS